MSFDTLKKDDLLSIADQFGVDVKVTDTKQTIIAALVEDGVTWEQATTFDKAAADADVVIKEEKAIDKANGPKSLIKMTRANNTYEIRGYKFTKQHPFALVSEDDAEFITENVDGFHYASSSDTRANGC